MKCAWQAFINLLPVWMRETVDKHGREDLQELRMRLNAPPELIKLTESVFLERIVGMEDLTFVVNLATRYSPWSAATLLKGFITTPGGHRLGVCGEAVMKNGEMTGYRSVTSLNIRVARDFPGIANIAVKKNGSVLIIGRPGSGKTTLLRDYIRCLSNADGGAIAVIDERQEIFPQVHNQYAFSVGRHTDVLSGCDKPHGIEIALRNLGPEVIAVDEITAAEDCSALLHAGWCGVRLIATAHAGSAHDLYNRPVYRPLVKSGLFDTLLVMQKDKTWTAERICQ